MVAPPGVTAKTLAVEVYVGGVLCQASHPAPADKAVAHNSTIQPLASRPPVQLSATAGEHRAARRPLWPALLWTALVLWLADLLLRRVRLFERA